MKFLKAFILALAIIFLLSVAWFINWANHPLLAAPDALATLQSDSRVKVMESKRDSSQPVDYISFSPADPQQDVYTGFIFYPGAHVDPRAYAAPLREIAAHGYYVVLVSMPLNMAIFDIDAANYFYDAEEKYSDLQWVVGGHSLGGAAAAMNAAKYPLNVNGLILWGAFMSDNRLQELDFPVLSIYGTRDMAGLDAFESSRSFMPVDTRYVVIEGGNHSQFGDYGLQPGDNEAAISRSDQQSQIIAAVLDFLAYIESLP